MKTIALSIIAIAMSLSSCSTIPVAASYSGAVAGHNIIVGYSGKDGVAVAVSQK